MCSASPQDVSDSPPADEVKQRFELGAVVQVEARMQPGQNKPGGVARIVACRRPPGAESPTFDVKYVLGGREKGVSARFISDFSAEKNDRSAAKMECPSKLGGSKKRSGGTNAAVKKKKKKKRHRVAIVSSGADEFDNF